MQKTSTSKNADKIIINLTHSLELRMYNEDLTLKTCVSDAWEKAQVKQNGKTQSVNTTKDEKGVFIIYQATPNAGAIEISKATTL